MPNPLPNYDSPYQDLGTARVVVTGGCGTLGSAVGHACASLGASVWLLDLAAPARVMTHEGRSHGRGMIHERMANVRERASLERIRDELEAKGGATVLVNAAGMQRRTDFAGCDEATWQEIMDTNMNGVYRSCQVFGEAMRKHGGSIVNFSSVHGVVVPAQGSPYGIAKAAVSYMTRVMAIEWAPTVRVNAIAPTTVHTGMTAHLYASEAYVEAKRAEIPLGRVGTVEDIVHAVLYLASSASGLITGQTLVMDGGISLR